MTLQSFTIKYVERESNDAVRLNAKTASRVSVIDAASLSKVVVKALPQHHGHGLPADGSSTQCTKGLQPLLTTVLLQG